MNSQIQKKLRKQGHVFAEWEDSADKSQTEKPFFKWFWEDVLGYSSEEYVRTYWREVHRGHTIGPKPKVFGLGTPSGVTLQNIDEGFEDTLFRFIIGSVPAVFFYLIRHIIRRYIQRLQRPSYYERERERRITLGHVRRAITVRTTTNAQPAVDEIRAAWNGARHSPEGALRLGGMLEDLECYVNNRTIGNEVEGYRGRRGGIKRLLQEKAPDLFEHYAALMRYKSIARKFRQACEISDPDPADALLPLSAPPRPQKVRTNWSEQIKQGQERTLASVGKSADKPNDVVAVTTGSTEKRSEPIKQRQDGVAVDVHNAEVKLSEGTAVSAGTSRDGKNCSEQIKSEIGMGGKSDGAGRACRSEGTGSVCRSEGTGSVCRSEGIGSVCKLDVVQKGVKSWVLDGFMFAWREDCRIRRESYETAIRVFRACENSVISLEAALALEIDPNCVTAESVARYGTQCEQIVPNKSSDMGQGTVKRGLVLSRVAKWLKRRTCA